jgi:hypothetical protein
MADTDLVGLLMAAAEALEVRGLVPGATTVTDVLRNRRALLIVRELRGFVSDYQIGGSIGDTEQGSGNAVQAGSEPAR